MIVTRLALLMIPLGLAACNAAPVPGFAGERSVFSNPYVQPVIDQRGIGPGCEVDAEPGSLCTSGGAIYPGRGHFALAPMASWCASIVPNANCCVTAPMRSKRRAMCSNRSPMAHRCRPDRRHGHNAAAAPRRSSGKRLKGF